MKPRLLIVGGLPDEKRKLNYGGATVLMKNFLDYLDSRGISYKFVQTNKYSNIKTGLPDRRRNALHFCASFFWNFWTAGIIMFNYSNHSTAGVFPLLCRLSKLMGKKVILRKFGGPFETAWNELTEHGKTRLANALNKADLILIETKGAIDFFRTITNNERIVWFPNVRQRKASPKTEKQAADYRRRFVFMAHVKKEKGVDELLECFRRLPADYSVDIYGQLVDYQAEQLHAPNCRYCGILQPQDVFATLKQYDCLILPSYREGYPGIIIESFSMGVPSIATSVGGIPEIVEHGQNGFLVPPRDPAALEQAARDFDRADHVALSRNALQSFKENFDSDTVNCRITETIMNLC